MTHVHKRFTDDQLRSLFRAYDDGQGEEVGGPAARPGARPQENPDDIWGRM